MAVPILALQAFSHMLHAEMTAANRLAAARMQIGLWRGERSSTLNTQPIRSFEVWLPRDPDQRVLWSSQLRLDQEFYESLREHALPVDIRALRAFSQSAKQIDLVLWLGYRLRNLERPYQISWSALKEQFGADVAASRKFKQGFLADLKAVQEVYPSLGVTINERGIVLRPGASQLFSPGNRPRRLS